MDFHGLTTIVHALGHYSDPEQQAIELLARAVAKYLIENTQAIEIHLAGPEINGRAQGQRDPCPHTITGVLQGGVRFRVERLDDWSFRGTIDGLLELEAEFAETLFTSVQDAVAVRTSVSVRTGNSA